MTLTLNENNEPDNRRREVAIKEAGFHESIQTLRISVAKCATPLQWLWFLVLMPKLAAKSIFLFRGSGYLSYQAPKGQQLISNKSLTYICA